MNRSAPRNRTPTSANPSADPLEHRERRTVAPGPPDAPGPGATGVPPILLRGRAGVRVDRDSHGLVSVSFRDRRVIPGRLHQAQQEALIRLLGPGGFPGVMEEQVAADGALGVAEWHWILGVLERLSALEAVVQWNGETMGVLVPLSPGFHIAGLPPLPNEPLGLSEFALIRRVSEGLRIESPLALARVDLYGPGAALLPALALRASPSELAASVPIPRAAALSLLSLLHAPGLLAPLGKGGRTETDEAARAHGWTLHDLFFHYRTRLGRSDEPYGARRNGWETHEDHRRSAGSSLLRLPTPDTSVSPPQEPSLLTAMETRRSVRIHGVDPIDLHRLGAFLFRSAGNRPLEEAAPGTPAGIRRTYPSGGARYPLEVYVLVGRARGLDRGLYRYDPSEHGLDPLAPMTEELEGVLSEYGTRGGVTSPQVLLLITACMRRTAGRYDAIAYSLILKEVGALMQSMYLVATALDLAPCAVGGGESDLLSRLLGVDPLEEAPVGEFLLGSRGDEPGD